MFICQICKMVSRPCESQFKVILERRETTYPMSMDNARSGWEIKKEVAACQSCYLEHRPAAEQTVVGDALTRAKAKLEDSAAPQLARLNFSVIKLAEAMGRLSPGGTV